MIKDPIIKKFTYPNKEDIKKEDLLHFIEKHQTERIPIYEENLSFITQTNIKIDKTFQKEEENNKFSGIRHRNNICNLILKTHLNYLMGDGISYTDKGSEEDDESLEKFLEIRKNKDFKTKEYKTVEEMGKMGTSYSLIYLNEDNEIQWSILEPKQTFVIYSSELEGEPIWGVRYYTDFFDNEIIELWGKSFYRKYKKIEDEEEYIIEEEKENIFNIMPVVEFRNDEYGFSDFQPIKPHIDDINKTITTQSNLIHYINDAILILKNIGVDEEEVEKMFQNKIVSFNTGEPNIDIGMDFLKKPIDTDSIKQHLNILIKGAFRDSFTPLMTSEEISKAPSGKSLQSMYLTADLVASQKEARIREGMKRVIRIIFKMLNFRRLTDVYNNNNIEPKFSRNLPTITISEIEDLLQVNNVQKLSTKTNLELLPNKYVSDAEEEMERIQEQTKKNITYDFIEEEEEEEKSDKDET